MRSGILYRWAGTREHERCLLVTPPPPRPVDRCMDQYLAHVPLRVTLARDPRPVPVGTFECPLEQILRLGIVPASEQTRHREQTSRRTSDELFERRVGHADDVGPLAWFISDLARVVTTKLMHAA